MKTDLGSVAGEMTGTLPDSRQTEIMVAHRDGSSRVIVATVTEPLRLPRRRRQVRARVLTITGAGHIYNPMPVIVELESPYLEQEVPCE